MGHPVYLLRQKVYLLRHPVYLLRQKVYLLGHPAASGCFISFPRSGSKQTKTA
ncbi:MAG: hypothetical protein LBD24_05735 [Spirochaetaceae bacterium]|nr:hypothetical protein [Spirochaetaceae bacterium]